MYNINASIICPNFLKLSCRRRKRQSTNHHNMIVTLLLPQWTWPVWCPDWRGPDTRVYSGWCSRCCTHWTILGGGPFCLPWEQCESWSQTPDWSPWIGTSSQWRHALPPFSSLHWAVAPASLSFHCHRAWCALLVGKLPGKNHDGREKGGREEEKMERRNLWK